jgi:alkylation response protein AidB-like acyl-CoA dehydrogenase
MDPALFDDDHIAYRESVETFLTRHAVPAYGSWTAAREIPREVLRQAGEDGFLGMGVPERFGGLGIEDPRFGAVVSAAAMEAGVPALALVLGLHTEVVVPALTAYGAEGLRERWLSRLASGDVVGTLVEGELEITDTGSGPIITGTAEFVPGGASADLFLVCADHTAALIGPGAPGLAIRPSDDGIGLAAAGFADLQFSAAHAYALEVEAHEFSSARRDLIASATAAAGAREALALTIGYVRDRKVFGVPLGSLENSREVVATMVGLTDSATVLAEQTLRSAIGGKLTPARAAAAAIHCISAYRDVVDRGVQLHGGYGYILEYPISRAYADAQFWALQGDVSAQRREAVAHTFLD